MSIDEIMLQYYPHKDACPQEGKPCLKDKCKYWVEEKVCWDIEFGSIVKSVFGSERHDYIYYDLQDINYPKLCLRPELWLENKTDFKQPPKVVISIGINSFRLAEKLKEKFNLTQWEIESRCQDGGDDHDLVMTTHASYLERNEIIKMLERIKEELIPKIILEEKSINTCNLCKTRCESLTDHDKYAICYSCEKRIISENLPNYF